MSHSDRRTAAKPGITPAIGPPGRIKGRTMPAERQTPLIGVALMLGAMASLPFIDVLAKFLGQQGVPILLVVCARLSFGALVTLPMALRHGGPKALIPARPYFHAARAGFLMLATYTFFLALSYLPIADTLAIFFVQPLVITMLAPIALGETVGPRRWAAVVTGFIGTLIIIRPGFAELNPGVPLALCAGTSLAIYFIMTRKISGQAPAMLTTFHTCAIGGLILLPFMPLVWLPPTPTQWLMLASLGAIATFGHYLIVRAYDHAEASLLAPLAYSEMIMATAVGWYFFNDLPDRWTLLGVSILIASAIYISVRSHAPTPDPHP